MSADSAWLFTVNAGSNDVSVFSVQPRNLTLVDRVSFQGINPISLTVHGSLLYVLNAGNASDPASIAGFRFSSRGKLSFISGSIRPLSSLNPGSTLSPEEIGFSPDGDHLVVTEKGSNLIDSYNLKNGVATGPTVNNSSGVAPYGFDFSSGNHLVVSEAAKSAASSYKLIGQGLAPITVSVLDTQAAACWLVVTCDGVFTYAANAASGTISGYAIDNQGNLSLLRSDGINGVTGPGSHPVDMAFGDNDNFLYVLASGNQTILLCQAQERRPPRIQVHRIRRLNDPQDDILASRATQHQSGRANEGQECAHLPFIAAMSAFRRAGCHFH